MESGEIVSGGPLQGTLVSRPRSGMRTILD